MPDPFDGKGAIKVDGLAQFNRDLKKLDADLPKALRLALNEVADLVLSDARPQVPRKSGRAQRSMKARSTRTKVRVKAGGRRASYFPWLDFGGRVGRNNSIVRPFYKDGRYLYRSYFELKMDGRFQDKMSEALVNVARQAGVVVD